MTAPMTSSMLLAFSDRRLKKNIRYVHGPWARWDWNGAAATLGLSGSGYGLIAQDVLRYAPHAVLRHESGYLMVNYGGL